jgi:hypothetical protein
MKIFQMVLIPSLLLIGACSQSTTPVTTQKVLIKDAKAGSVFLFSANSTDTSGSNITIDESRYEFEITDSGLAVAGKTHVSRIHTFNYIIGFFAPEPNGDISIGDSNSGVITWTTYPIATKGTITTPKVDSVSASGDTTIVTASRTYMGQEDVTLAGTTFNAIKVREMTWRHYGGNGNSSSKTTDASFWYVPELKFFGKMTHAIRDTSSGIIDRSCDTLQLILYAQKAAAGIHHSN